MICDICQTEFEPHHHKQKYCKKECSHQAVLISIKESQKKRRKDPIFREKTRIRSKEYYRTHKEQAKKAAKKYYSKNRDKILQYNKKYKQKGVRYRISYFKLTLIKYFLDKYTEKGSYLMHLQFLFECYQQIAKTFNIKIDKRVFSGYLTRLGIKKISGLDKITQLKIEGIKLNKRGVKRFGIKNVANLDIDKSISSGDACVLVLCTPGRETIQELYKNGDEYLKSQIDLEKTLKIYKQIENALFRRNIYKYKKVKIATALYVANKKTSGVSQFYCAELVDTNTVSLRGLMKLLKIR